MTTASECPPEDELVRMVEGALGDASLAMIESHVDTCDKCAAVIAGLGALDSAAAKPRRVGRYQLDRRIGGGGMGEVWAAWDPQLRRDIAVKLVKPERADDDRERERLLREARALARLTHPNVLAVYDVGETDDGEVFIATELVVGDTLASRGSVNAEWRALARLYAQAARGLAAAHATGLVHRDVKPANLLLGVDGRVRVADFGLAIKSATPMPSPLAATDLASRDSAQVQITQTGYIAGTPAYMAPEQRLGEPADARADQYALCIALAEGIAGRRPPLDLDRDAMIAFVAERRTREPDLDRLCGAIARGLSIDREARFPTADVLADELEASALTGSSGEAGVAEGVTVRATSSRGPRRRAIAIAAVAAALGVTGVLVAARALERDGASGLGSAGAGSAGAGSAVAGSAVAVATLGSDARSGEGVMPDVPDASLLAGSAVVGAAIPSGSNHRGTVPRPGSGSPPGLPTTPITSRPPSWGADQQQQVDLGLAAVRRALVKYDARGCRDALARLPTNVPVMTGYNIDVHRGECEMLLGNCAAGIALVDRGLEGIGSPPNGQAVAIQYCPITGSVETRLQRLTAQVNLRAKSPVACRGYLAAARTVAGEVTSAIQKSTAANVLRAIARCVGDGGACAEATTLWDEAHAIDDLAIPMQVGTCATVAPLPTGIPNSPTAQQVTAVTDALQKAQQAIRQRDVQGCKSFGAVAAQGVPVGLELSVELVRGTCEMMLGNCTAGSNRIAKAYAASPTGAHPQTVPMTADLYCPITGTLDQRLTRMTAQLNAFADRRSPQPSVAWCSYLVTPARLAAGEARTDVQRTHAAEILQRLATCVSTTGRCDQARDLWAIAVSTDANADPAPKLAAKCP